MSWLKSLLGAFGSAVDTAVPVATGNRTVIAVLVGLGAKYLPILLPLIPPPYGPAIVALLPVVNQLVSVLVPVFAAAHVARSVA